jgi:outer membrane protein
MKSKPTVIAKRIIPILLFVFLKSSIFAQTQKGNFILSGKTDLNFLFSNITTGTDSVQIGKTKSNQFGFTAGAGYFIADNLSAGISTSYSYSYSKIGASNYQASTQNITQSFTILPQLQYYFPIEEKLKPFVAIGMGYVWLQERDSRIQDNYNKVYNLSGIAFSGGLGVSYFITTSVAFDLGLQYSYNRLKDELINDQIIKQKQFAGNLGVSFFNIKQHLKLHTMKYASLYCFLFTLFVSSILSAQQTRFVLPLPAINAQSTESQTSSITTSAKFELLDLTGDSFVLGYLPLKDGGNERQAIVTPVGKSDWLRAITSGNAAASFAGRANPILYALNDISVGRSGSGNYVRLKATIYEEATAGYILLNKVDTLITDNAININRIGDLISTAISSTASLLNTGIVQASSPKRLSREEVVKQEKENYAFIRNGINPTGIYMSYEEFKASKPSFEQLFIKTDTVTKTIQVNSFAEKDSMLKPVTPWGIAVNNELYVYQNNKLYPVEAVGSNLVFSKFIDPDTRKNNASFWRMTVGENLSGKYANVFDNVNTLTLINYHGKGLNGEAIKVNADTGTPEF